MTTAVDEDQVEIACGTQLSPAVASYGEKDDPGRAVLPCVRQCAIEQFLQPLVHRGRVLVAEPAALQATEAEEAFSNVTKPRCIHGGDSSRRDHRTGVLV